MVTILAQFRSSGSVKAIYYLGRSGYTHLIVKVHSSKHICCCSRWDSDSNQRLLQHVPHTAEGPHRLDQNGTCVNGKARCHHNSSSTSTTYRTRGLSACLGTVFKDDSSDRAERQRRRPVCWLYGYLIGRARGTLAYLQLDIGLTP